MADATNTAAEEGEAPAKGRSKVAIAAIAVFLIGAAITVGLVVLPKDSAHEKVVEEPKAVTLLPIPQVLVNLAQNDAQRLLQATVSLEAKAKTEMAITDRFNVDLPKVQDLMIRVLSAYSAADLDGGSNKQAVQSRLVNALNEELFSDGVVEVTAVYFTEFVIQ